MGKTTKLPGGHRVAVRDIKDAIAAERREMADLLDDLPPEAWEVPSLCAGWRVREVAAHMSLGFRYSRSAVAAELLRARGSLHRMTDRCARKDAERHSTTRLASFLRENAHHAWTPPVGGFVSALGHDVVHGLDITVALDHARRVPEDRLRVLLTAVTPRTCRFFGADLSGVRLAADDLNWSFGSGSTVSGAAQDLLLAAYGRTLPAGRLSGDASHRFVAAPATG
ncbi:maleylpyruvate isomerase family mycothiol-dependent enzyme [Streptomyces sp. NPDC047108]|uniref:maleylpyruvate isomerase family mycothiol-dependent enzyme n=1 Tax=Streptomyces sp. NPDC047108 TaxID=3155025 RepID=UPI0033E54A6D